MAKGLAKLVAVLILAVSMAGATWYYLEQSSASKKLAAAAKENQVLGQIIERLAQERRMAELIVTDKHVENGKTRTTLLFAQADAAGQSGPAKTITLSGEMVHIAAQVIKFDRDYVRHNDPLRGHSIALFMTIYGSDTAPKDGIALDEPGQAPKAYATGAGEFEAGLWRDFWKMAGDASYASSRGVRVANGQEVFGPFEVGKHYTITVEADGGMNLIARPMDAVYRAAVGKAKE